MSRTSISRKLLRGAAALLATPAVAQTGDDPYCRNGLFAGDPPFELAEVAEAARSYFHHDMNGCPTAADRCREGRYVVPGDEVIIGKRRGEFACAYFVPSDTAGWIRIGTLALKRVDPMPETGKWIGRWDDVYDVNTIDIAAAPDGGLSIDGTAYWPGRPGTADYPATHMGDIGGQLVRLGNRARYDGEFSCRIDFTLLGPYLLAGDNGECGGMNVRFSGVYRRAQ